MLKMVAVKPENVQCAIEIHDNKWHKFLQMPRRFPLNTHRVPSI